MGKRRQLTQREALLEEMQKIAGARVNDGVKLAYLTEEQVDLIDQLDLTALTEFKRSSNGVVEVKFNDRMKTMEQLLALTDGAEDNRMSALLSALGGES